MTEQIIKLIDILFADTKVTREATKDNLTEIQNHVESLLETLD